MRVVVGSTNPVKVSCVTRAFAQAFPVATIEVLPVPAASGVADQPMGDGETLLGARGRAADARARNPQAEYWVGIEGGLEWHEGILMTMAWVVILGPEEKEGRSRTATFPLPQRLVDLIQTGHELGAADDIVFGRTNSKHQSGTVGALTAGLIDRAEYYRHACLLALIPFMDGNRALFPNPQSTAPGAPP